MGPGRLRPRHKVRYYLHVLILTKTTTRSLDLALAIKQSPKSPLALRTSNNTALCPAALGTEKLMELDTKTRLIHMCFTCQDHL